MPSNISAIAVKSSERKVFIFVCVFVFTAFYVSFVLDTELSWLNCIIFTKVPDMDGDLPLEP